MTIALGSGGQFIIVVPDLELVVVLTASNYPDEPGMMTGIEMVIDAVIPMVAPRWPRVV